MLGRSCSSLREGGGGVWEGLAERVFEAHVTGGVVGSRVKVSFISSSDMYGLCSFEQGTTDMEMERPWVLVGCRGVEGLPELEWRELPSCWGSEL